MIIVNTGSGKGKTTSAIGQVIRALGHKQKVCMVQLFKGENFYGEQNILSTLEGLDFFSYAKQHPYCFSDITKEQAISDCAAAIDKLNEIKDNNKYDLIVLEEFNIALRDGYIKYEILIDIIKKLSSKSHIMITGRGAPEKLIECADLVSDITEVKHPYRKGIQSQKGIEF